MSAPREEVLQSLLAHLGEFRAFLVRRTGDEALAEDLLQDVLIRSVERLDTIRDPSAAVAWFYRALRNALVDSHRRQVASHRKLAAFAAELEGTPSAETDNEVCRCVLRLAEELKPEYSEALRRTAVEDVPLREFAEEAGIGCNHAAVRAHRARAALKKQVHRACGACAARGCQDCTCEH